MLHLTLSLADSLILADFIDGKWITEVRDSLTGQSDLIPLNPRAFAVFLALRANDDDQSFIDYLPR